MGKDNVTYKGRSIRIRTVFSVEIIKARMAQTDVLQNLRDQRCQHRQLYPIKLSITVDGGKKRHSILKPNLSIIYLQNQTYIVKRRETPHEDVTHPPKNGEQITPDQQIKRGQKRKTHSNMHQQTLLIEKLSTTMVSTHNKKRHKLIEWMRKQDTSSVATKTTT